MIKEKISWWKAEDTILVDGIADLKEVKRKAGIVWIKQHTTLFDGGHGAFVFHAATLRTDANDGTIIAPNLDPGDTTTTTGCWHRLFDLSHYSLSFFGVSSEDTANLLSAYGTTGAVVAIVNAAVITHYRFDEAEVPNHDGTNNINGWIKLTHPV